MKLGAMKSVFECFGRNLAVLSFALALVAGAARASECDETDRAGEGVIGLYSDWIGVPEEAARQYENQILRYLGSKLAKLDPPISVCAITKVVFTPLPETDLWEEESVRRMLRDTTKKLGKGETMIQKIRKRNISHLVFVKFESMALGGANSNAVAPNPSVSVMAVRIDPTNQYPNEAFAYTFNFAVSNEHFADFTKRSIDAVASAIDTLRRPPEKTVSVLVMCLGLDEKTTREQEMSQGYSVNWATRYVPAQLAEKLRAIYPNQFVAEFEGPDCTLVNAAQDSKKFKDLLNSTYGEGRWIVWKGQLSLPNFRTIDVNFVFLHDLNRKETRGFGHWEGTTAPLKLPEQIAWCVKEKWESYLKMVGIPVNPQPMPNKGNLTCP
jgi:hypothetical protein